MLELRWQYHKKAKRKDVLNQKEVDLAQVFSEIIVCLLAEVCLVQACTRTSFFQNS